MIKYYYRYNSYILINRMIFDIYKGRMNTVQNLGVRYRLYIGLSIHLFEVSNIGHNPQQQGQYNLNLNNSPALSLYCFFLCVRNLYNYVILFQDCWR